MTIKPGYRKRTWPLAWYLMGLAILTGGLYGTDIDKWELWERRIEDVIASVDVALLDGTFHAEGEIPGRSMAEIPHPLIQDTLQRCRGLPADQRRKVIFTHLNHTNPAVDPDSAATAHIVAAGMAVAKDGQCFGL